MAVTRTGGRREGASPPAGLTVASIPDPASGPSAALPEAVTLPFFSTRFDAATATFAPPGVQARAAITMLDELLRRANAPAGLRVPPAG